ncbi:hypothetical protein KI387_010784, partial [Taxus chinensis]
MTAKFKAFSGGLPETAIQLVLSVFTFVYAHRDVTSLERIDSTERGNLKRLPVVFSGTVDNRHLEPAVN